MTTIDTGVLSELLPDELTLLMAIGGQQHPVGARLAWRALEESGVQISEASVSRMLGKLDTLGLTRAVGRKGRVLTPAGHEAFASRRTQERRDESFDRALELRSSTELLDWLRARRVIESEAAYLAAQRLDDGILSELESAVAEHERAAQTGNLGFRTVGMDLHILVARAAQSPIFVALIDSLTSPTVERVESALDLITARRGTLGDSAADHRALLESIRARDADGALRLMRQHLVRLEDEVGKYLADAEGESLLAVLSAL